MLVELQARWYRIGNIELCTFNNACRTRIIKRPEKKSYPEWECATRTRDFMSKYIMSGKIKIRMAFKTMRTMNKMEK